METIVTDRPPAVRDYTDLAQGYDAHRYVSPADRMNEEFRRRALERLLPDRAHCGLDVACGTGRGVLVLRERVRFVVGADATFEMLRQAKRKTGEGRPAAFCTTNGACLPFPDGSFDVVTCLNFLHLFPERRDKCAFMSEIARVVRPGGTAVVEFDNAMHGLLLGPYRKYVGQDIGYDWPWVIRACFPATVFSRITIVGANIPFVWRVRGLRALEKTASAFPFKYLANRLFVGAIRAGSGPWW